MWKAFLAKWNGRSFFLDSFVTSTPDLELYTDAASTIGFGGYVNGKWFQGRWPPHMLIDKRKGISIEWQELFPIVLACALCYPHFSGKRLQFWCDNESVVAIINSDHSKAPRIMHASVAVKSALRLPSSSWHCSYLAISYLCLYLVRSSPYGAGEIRKALPILLSYTTLVGR